MKKKTIKNVFGSIFYQLIYLLCGLLIPRILIDGYGSNTYALITSITQFLSYIILLESGIGVVVKSLFYKAITKKDEKEIVSIFKSCQGFFNKILIIFVFYIIMLCIFYPYTSAANTFDKVFTISLILIISISTFFEYFFGMTYKLFLQSDQKSYIISYIQIITYIINTFVIILLVKLKVDIRIVKLSSSIIFIFRPIFQNIYVRWKYKFNYTKYDKNYKIPNRYDGLSQHVAGLINSNSDVILLSLFTNISNVAIYSIYNMIISNLKSFINSFIVGTDAAFGLLYANKEEKKLSEVFNLYESFYLIIITIIYSCTFILIIPFIAVYTKGITDVNYVNTAFAFTIVLANYVHSIKNPYNSLAYDVGKFKETKKGAWLEAIINVVVSLILVFKFGLVGVIIGTLCSVIYRCLDFVIFISNHILKRNVFQSLKKIFLAMFQTLFLFFISKLFDFSLITNYIQWIIAAIIIFIVVCLFVFLTSFPFYKKEFKKIIKLLKRRFK
ncbi:MAG: polysaccharide biosynthesis C-terminal domain-containing protein [Bacilli bacterium]|nr:polysaccharide biosynthesis C-terminal domain-containing protein [Bacilli bacterium]